MVDVVIYAFLYQLASSVLVLKLVSYCLIRRTVKCVCILKFKNLGYRLKYITTFTKYIFFENYKLICLRACVYINSETEDKSAGYYVNQYRA